MVVAGILIGGGATYLGTRISQRRAKRQRLHRRYRDRQRLVDKLAPDSDPPMVKGFLGHGVPTEVAIGAGMMAAGGFLWWASATGMTPLLLTDRLITFLRNSPYGPGLYLVTFAVAPLVFFPASLLTIAGGTIFGTVSGTLMAMIGSSASSLLAYGIGRRLRRLHKASIARRESYRRGDRFGKVGSANNESTVPRHLKMLRPYTEQMQAQPFVTTMTMHLLFLPFDLVSYGAGLLALDWRLFLAGTVVGSLPETLFLVQAGAALPGGMIAGVPMLNPAPLLISGLLVIGGMVFARRLNQRQLRPNSTVDSDIEMVAATNVSLAPTIPTRA